MFDLDRAMDNDGQCMMQSSSTEKRLARIICTDAAGEYPIVAIVDGVLSHLSSTIEQFDRNFRLKGRLSGCHLINLTENITAWVIAYRHKLKGEIKLSVKSSAWDKDGLIQDLYRLGHQILDVKSVNLEEGNFHYQSNIIDSELLMKSKPNKQDGSKINE